MCWNVLLRSHQLPLYGNNEHLYLSDKLKGEYYSVYIHYVTVVERSKVI